MININNNSKIYIVSPYMKFGGPRSLHQLCDVLIKNGYEAYMVYIDNNIILNKNKSVFDEYRLNTISQIEDNECNVLLVPEALTGFLFNYRNIRKVVWWLSLYYYRINDIGWYTNIALQRRGLSKIYYPFVYIKKLLTTKKEKYIKDDDFKDIYHLYNSQYACDYIKTKGVDDSHLHYLCGPLINKYKDINKQEIISKKENIVAYNPLKVDHAYFSKIKNQLESNNIKIVEIKNMTTDEVFETLSKTKVYLELGYHPGVERIPREAVCLYCNVITSNLGTASNSTDVPIKEDYKFELNKDNVVNISNLCIDMVNNYNNYIDDFDLFREKAISQIDNFEESIIEIFSKE